MESMQFDCWVPPNQFIPQTGIFDFPSDVSSLRSTSGSPVSRHVSFFRQRLRSPNSSTGGAHFREQTSSNFESMPVPVYHTPYPHSGEDFSFAYQVAGVAPRDMGSPDDTPYCSSRQGSTELSNPYPQAPQERIHTTSGRRRAQNRAAQRAFRERKEKHAKDLETQLAALTERYRSLESSHAELSAAYDKLRKTIELLTKDDTFGGPGNSSGVEVLRKVLGILHAEVLAESKSREGSVDSGVKMEEAGPEGGGGN